MENKENKKVYKIGDNVEIENLQEVAQGIVKKALKVIEAGRTITKNGKKVVTGGNNWATKILEGKDVETFEDLKSIVILEIIENNYKITKECYKKINKYMYNYKMEKKNTIEIVINEEANTSNLDYNSYVQFVQEKSTYYEEVEEKQRFSVEWLNLTEKQKEILNIYSKFNSYEKTAEILGVTKSTIQTTINRIKKKTQALCYNIY